MIQPKSIDNNQLILEVERLIRSGRTVTMTAKGRSMRPFIENERDKVLLDKPDIIKVNDVVLAKTKEKGYVIHRLTELDRISGQCVLRGDGNISVEHCCLTDIIAKVVMIYRKQKQKPCSVDSLKWKTYSWLWTKLLPIRRYLLYINRRLILKTNY